MWNRIAECESSGGWSIDTGNSYYGGLQFSDQTWDSFGGEQYAPTADQASREQQIAVAERVLAEQGWGAWPTCSQVAGDGPPPDARSPQARRTGGRTGRSR